jgi:hypothetical protein
MSVPGSWTLHFDWSCGGSYGTTPITFNANGTFASAPYTGKWSSHDGEIVFRFDQPQNAVYGGSVIDSAMVGISTTFAGLNGCWYALKAGTTIQALTQIKGGHDQAGEAKK